MYPEEFYEFEHILTGLDEELVLMFLGIIGVVAMVVGLVAIVCYVFQSIGLYTIAKRRGIANPWLAWLPIGYYWIAGSIADQYRYVTGGEIKNRRTILLALAVASAVVSSLISSMATGSLVLTTSAPNVEHLAALGSWTAVANLVSSGLRLATLVFWHIALYDLYNSCNPKNSTLFLVLGIVFGFLVPFFIFACRNREDGMPPRREEPQYDYQPNYEPRTYREPWDNP